MKKIFKPASLLFYLVSVLVFFFAGVYYAVLTGAAEGEGLAAGAIVIGYGVFTAFIAFLVSIVCAYYLSGESIVRLNQLFGIILLFFIAITAYRVITRERFESGSDTSTTTSTPPDPSTTAPPLDQSSGASINSIDTNEDGELGLGFFKPDFYNRSVLYIYGVPNLEKPVSAHHPVDSLVFHQLDGHQYAISYAPPWLVPEHLKMDYEILYFRILGIHRDFIQIDVNKTNDRFAYVSRNAGDIIFWPDFLLSVHTIKFTQHQPQTVRVRPLNYAGQVNINFEFMKPLQIQNDWMEVELLNQKYQKVGDGWIRWRNEKKLLIEYRLLS